MVTSEQEAELRYYRELLGAVCLLYEKSRAIDSAPTNPEDERTLQAWDEYWDAAEEVFDFVRCEEHAAMMENDLHRSKTALSA